MAAQAHPVFEGPPDPDVKIWRYMALSKFVWMIQKRALYFCRADLLGDRGARISGDFWQTFRIKN